MPDLRLLRTTTFRIALAYVGLFSLSVLIILGAVYATTAGLLDRQTNETIAAELQGLREQYRQRGLPGLVRTVRQRSAAPHSDGLYLILDPQGLPVAGNLPAWPDARPDRNGWIHFDLTALDADESGPPAAHRRTVRAKGFVLAGDYRLLVGRDLSERQRFDERLTAALALGLGLTVGFGMLGGVLLSRNVVGRIEAINRTARRIMGGELSERVTLSGSGDELDQLATNLNAMLDRIERLMDEMRHVAESIAHDLRSPLSRLRTRLEMALLDVRSDGAARAALQDAVAEADRLLVTFESLLAIAEIEAGHQRTDFEELDLADVAREVVELYEPVAEDKGQALAVDLRPALVRGHRQLLSQALANLLDNAVKYTPPGGRVTVATALQPGGPALSVTDNGPGIPPADRERVLRRFVRLEESRSTAGNGLGLALVEAVARLHGGRVVLDDAGPGLRATLGLPQGA